VVLVTAFGVQHAQQIVLDMSLAGYHKSHIAYLGEVSQLRHRLKLFQWKAQACLVGHGLLESL
jgi:hypothetical protein